MHISLIVPAPFDTVSGGYVYDRRIVADLRAAGHDMAVVELAGAHPVCDELARDSACAAWERLAPGTKPLIDGLALPAFAGLDDALVARGASALIHHPTSLETGLDETTRDSLFAIEKRLFHRMRRLVVTSDTTADRLVGDFALDREHIQVVIPGTDEAPRCSGSTGSSCHILSVGTLVPRKGHDLLLRSLARLFDLDWHLTIVGSPDRDPVHAHGLIALADECGIAQRVSFAGEVVGEALEDLWRDADLFALATHYEGFGMVVAEALKRGLPVAVTAGGAAGALVGPEAGVVCPVGDQDQLSKALRRLIFSCELRQDMAEVAWQTGQALPSWQTQAALFAASLA
jgi:glycosyltransferase involved in cell wall biosynthesis